MMKLLQILTKRPKDKTILYSRIAFGFLLSISLYYNLIYQGDSIEHYYFWQDINENYLLYIKYLFVSLGLIPIVMGVTNICIAKKKYVKYIQMFFGIVLFYISSKIVEGPKLDVDVLIFLMAFFPLFAGITGKCITTKCLKYKEKITKIRV